MVSGKNLHLQNYTTFLGYLMKDEILQEEHEEVFILTSFAWFTKGGLIIMSYNHSKAESQFQKDWKKTLKQLKECNVPDSTIFQIYDVYRSDFNSERYFYEKTVQDEELLLNSEYVEPQVWYSSFPEFLEYIQNSDFKDILKGFSNNTLMVIYLKTLDHSNREIAKEMNCHESNISKKFEHIQKVASNRKKKQ